MNNRSISPLRPRDPSPGIQNYNSLKFKRSNHFVEAERDFGY